MKTLCILLCFTVYIASASEKYYPDYEPLEWYDEVDFDKLFEENNDDVAKEDVISSNEYRDPVPDLEIQLAKDRELKEQQELAPDALDKYSDDYQIEDNRSEVKDDVSIERKEEDALNLDDSLQKAEELESQELASDKVDDASIDQKKEDTPNDYLKELKQKLTGELESEVDTPDQDELLKKYREFLNLLENQEAVNNFDAEDDDLFEDKREDGSSNQDDVMNKFDDNLKEASDSANQEAASDFDAFQKMFGGEKTLDETFIEKILSEQDDDTLNLSDLFSDENKLQEDIDVPLPWPPVNPQANNREINQSQNDENEDNVNDYDIIEETKDIIEDTNNELDEVGENNNDHNSVEKELAKDNFEVDDIPEDTVDQVYDDLNDDLDKLLEIMDKLRQEDLPKEENAEAYVEINSHETNMKDLEVLHAKDQLDYDDTHDYDYNIDDKISHEQYEDEEIGDNNKKKYEIIFNGENKIDEFNKPADSKKDDDQFEFETGLSSSDLKHVFEEINLENEFDESNPDFHPADSKKDDQFDTDLDSAKLDDVFDESNPDFHPADSKKDDQFEDGFDSAKLDDVFDESNPNFHPADSKKDDQFDDGFDSAKLDDVFDESNPNFHSADSKKDDQFDTGFDSAKLDDVFDESNPDFHPADSKKDDQFDASFDSAELDDVFDESNPNFHPADSKKDDQFDVGFDSAKLDDVFDESNPDFHPADSEKDDDEFDAEVNVEHNSVDDETKSVELEKTLQDNKIENIDESADTITEDKEEETSETKITKDVNDLTGPELDQLTRQFVMFHKEELTLNSKNIEREATLMELDADYPVVITSPNYPDRYPTTGEPIDWVFEGAGHGIELNVTDLAINSAMGHYLLIKPGGVDHTGSDGIVFAFRLDQPRMYRFRDVDRLFVRFNGIGGAALRGFSMSVKMIEPLFRAEEELPEPEPVVPAPQAFMTLLLGGLNTTEFEEVREEFRRLLADMATVYILANDIEPGHNSTLFTTQITRTYVCQLNWPGFESCVEVRFAIPLVYDDEDDHDVDDDDDRQRHRLNETDLMTMWYQYIGQDPFATRLRRMGITEYTVPNDSSILMVWLVIVIGVLISMVMLACTLWRFSCFGSYTRMPAYSDTDSIQNEKRGLDMYPTPHQTLPPLYAENEYKWLDDNFDDTKVDIGGFTNNSYVRGDLSDESEEEVIASRIDTDV